ncbi:MAG: CDC27 family protein [Zoogloeaceae bacterium]|jgi:tetratricopeptide (TPR) repeat protein|nr:CDC27 family protein [Zoogloeaceae bacterium]
MSFHPCLKTLFLSSVAVMLLAACGDSARDLFSKGQALYQQGKYYAAIAAFDKVEQRFGKDNTPGVREQVARALLCKGHALNQQGKDEAAIVAFDEVEQRFGKDDSPGVREQVARALLGKGHALNRQGKDKAAIAVHDEIEQRFGKDNAPGVREQVARALLGKGHILAQRGKDEAAIAANVAKINAYATAYATYDAAITIYDEIERRFGKDDSPGVREQVARALLDRGHILFQRGKYYVAITAYDQVKHRFGKDDTPGVREQVARALLSKGRILFSPDAAITVYDEIERRFGKDNTPGVREQVAGALLGKGYSLREQRKDEASIAAFDEVERRFGKDDSPGVRKQVVTALALKSAAMDDDNARIAVHDEIERRLAKDGSPDARGQLLAIRQNSAALLLRLGRHAEAAQKIRQVMAEIDTADPASAILSFLLWLAEPQMPVQDVRNAIAILPPGVNISWHPNEIRPFISQFPGAFWRHPLRELAFDWTLPLVARLPEPRQIQAQCLLTFFQKHQNVDRLDACLL